MCPTSLFSDYAEVELLKPDLSDYRWTAPVASRSTLAVSWQPTSQAWTVQRNPGGAFRARVVFRRSNPASVNSNTPILESPVLDDLTFLYTASGGVPILSWREGE